MSKNKTKTKKYKQNELKFMTNKLSHSAEPYLASFCSYDEIDEIEFEFEFDLDKSEDDDVVDDKDEVE